MRVTLLDAGPLLALVWERHESYERASAGWRQHNQAIASKRGRKTRAKSSTVSTIQRWSWARCSGS